MRSAIILAAIVLSACQSEPSFDERYDTAQETIEAKAEELDAELQDGPTQVEEPPEKPAAE